MPAHAYDAAPPHASARDRRTSGPARAPLTAERRLHDLAASANASPVQRARAASETNGVRSSPNRTGLPDALKDGIEALSGIALHDVRVHRGSPRPALLGARAYAQGNDIHIAPGQEQHLPHEAWHVVQQRQGRVRPTLRIGDVRLNDDPVLERDADQMGRRALSGAPDRAENAFPDPPSPMLASAREAGDGSATPVVQRLLAPIPHPTTYKGPLTDQYQAAVGAFRDMLNERVDAAYRQASNWQALGNVRSAHVSRWYNTARTYVADPNVEPKIIYANFGYAIEEIACEGLDDMLFQGMKVETQLGVGATRPDVTLSAGGTAIAWLDITSVASTGHIARKMHSGWRTRPFIYEIVYPKLRLHDLLKVTNDPYYRELSLMLADEQQAVHDVREARRNEIATSLISLRDESGWSTGVGDKVAKQGATRQRLDELADFYGTSATFGPADAKGALRSLDIVNGPYGFNNTSPGIKSRSGVLDTMVNESTTEEIEEKHHNIYADHAERVIGLLQQSMYFPRQVQALAFEHDVEPGSRSTATAAMALLGAVVEQRQLQRLGFALVLESAEPFVALFRDVETLMRGPGTLTVATIDAWRAHARTLYDFYGTIMQSLAMADRLAVYLPSLRNLDRVLVQLWIGSLRRYPPSDATLNDAKSWLDEHDGDADRMEQ